MMKKITVCSLEEMQFYVPKDSFIFRPAYYPEGAQFYPEIQRFLYESRPKYCNQLEEAPIAVDLTEIASSEPNTLSRAFFYFLDDYCLEYSCPLIFISEKALSPEMKRQFDVVFNHAVPEAQANKITIGFRPPEDAEEKKEKGAEHYAS